MSIVDNYKEKVQPAPFPASRPDVASVLKPVEVVGSDKRNPDYIIQDSIVYVWSEINKTFEYAWFLYIDPRGLHQAYIGRLQAHIAAHPKGIDILRTRAQELGLTTLIHGI